jgi:hypothetical protein
MHYVYFEGPCNARDTIHPTNTSNHKHLIARLHPPLVHVADGHSVGLVSGRFEPAEVVRGSKDWDRGAARDINIGIGIALGREQARLSND